jgi:hypothetical protein
MKTMVIESFDELEQDCSGLLKGLSDVGEASLLLGRYAARI